MLDNVLTATRASQGPGHGGRPRPQKSSRRPERERRNGVAHRAPQGGSPPSSAASPTCLPLNLGHLQLYQPGFATVATPVVAPTLTALTHHAHAPTTPTTTQAATSDRHPQSEGSRPGTGMQGYLPQATIAASKPLRSSDASAGTPKHARRQQHNRPPSPINALRPPEPPQQLVSYCGYGRFPPNLVQYVSPNRYICIHNVLFMY